MCYPLLRGLDDFDADHLALGHAWLVVVRRPAVRVRSRGWSESHFRVGGGSLKARVGDWVASFDLGWFRLRSVVGPEASVVFFGCVHILGCRFVFLSENFDWVQGQFGVE